MSNAGGFHYLRVPRLAEELRILHGKCGFAPWLAALARTDVLILDDWALAPLEASTRADLLEIIEDRTSRIPSQSKSRPERLRIVSLCV